MSEITPTETPAAPAETTAETAIDMTRFAGLELKAERVPPTDNSSGGWYLYTEVGGVKWPIAYRKLGGLDDDLQELATPGFKEARAERYARESGRPRTEPGPGAV